MATPSIVSPPNGKMVPVVITVDAHDAVGPVISRVISITANDGATASDWDISDALRAAVRADRRGSSSGRVYVLTVETRDGAGNATLSTTQIVVPHDMR
jgi:hypothetical protein